MAELQRHEHNKALKEKKKTDVVRYLVPMNLNFERGFSSLSEYKLISGHAKLPKCISYHLPQFSAGFLVQIPLSELI